MEHHAHPNPYGLVIYASFLLYLVVVLVYGVRQMSKTKGTYLVRREGSVMLFRRPLPMRRSTIAITSVFVVMLLVMMTVAPSMANPIPFYFGCLEVLPLVLFFLYMAGPDDIRLDGSQHTYERTRGWPWKPATRLGSFDGIKGVCVSPSNNVLLLLEKPGPITKGVVLSSSGTKAEAEALVEGLKREYGFPIVPYPKK